MFCAISGVVPTSPVVSAKSGHLFEKRLVLEQLEQSGNTCPVTGQDLTPADLVEVRVAAAGAAAPRSRATSVPGMLDAFRAEWDATVLEAHALRGQLLDVKQQLSLALYEKDAARRVIAKLIKEREEIKRALVDGGGAAAASSSAPSSSAPSSSSSEAITTASLNAANQTLSTMRASRTKPEGWASNDVVRSFEEAASKTPHKSTAKGVLALVTHPSEPNLVLSGGADAQGKLLSAQTYKVQGTLSGHKGAVNCAAYALGDADGGSAAFPLTGSADGTVRVWDAAVSKSVKCRATLEGHAGAVTTLSAHGTLPFALSASAEDGSWRTWDLRTGTTVHQNLGGVQAAKLHPDGVLAFGGVARHESSANAVVMWDIRVAAGKGVAGTFGAHEDGPVACVALSQNGYHAASGSDNGTVKMWDMRKAGQDGALMATFGVDGSVHDLSYDHYGKYVAACGNTGVDVYAVKKWSAPLLVLRPEGPSRKAKKRKKANGDAAAAAGVVVRAACWARNATWLATGAMDRTIKFYAAAK